MRRQLQGHWLQQIVEDRWTHPAVPASTKRGRPHTNCVRQAGAGGWSWSVVREKHCYLAGGWSWRDVRRIHCSAGVLYHQPNTVSTVSIPPPLSSISVLPRLSTTATSLPRPFALSSRAAGRRARGCGARRGTGGDRGSSGSRPAAPPGMLFSQGAGGERAWGRGVGP